MVHESMFLRKRDSGGKSLRIVMNRVGFATQDSMKFPLLERGYFWVNMREDVEESV